MLTFPDHWSAYALAELARASWASRRSRTRASSLILGLNSRLESQSGQGGLNRVFRGELASGAGLGTVSEGLAALWRLSVADPRLADLTDNLGAPARTAGRAVERQIDRPKRRKPRARCSRAGPGSQRTATRRWTISAIRLRTARHPRGWKRSRRRELCLPAPGAGHVREPVPPAAGPAGTARRGCARGAHRVGLLAPPSQRSETPSRDALDITRRPSGWRAPSCWRWRAPALRAARPAREPELGGLALRPSRLPSSSRLPAWSCSL